MAPPRFRTRLFLTLLLFAVLPAAVFTLVWTTTLSTALPLLSGSAAWDRVAATGERALTAARRDSLSPATRAALAAHEQELTTSVTEARRYRYLAIRAVPLIIAAALGGLLVLTILASRVAGHLARQLSRPLDELVGWTDRIARALPVPIGPPRRGAPEFAVLRTRMRAMAADLDAGRARALEAERLRAFRETARQVAHELKNPLTPIRLAVARLNRDAPPALRDTVDVLATESARLEDMARSFSQFGRLPEGPAAEVDIGEMVRYMAKATVPPHIPVVVDIDDATPHVQGHYDALARAFSNVLLNACDACGGGGGSGSGGGGATDGVAGGGAGRGGGTISVRVGPTTIRNQEADIAAVELRVRDTGSGIPADQLAHIWEPYVTHKPGGTGLGLAITRQTVVAHGGRVAVQSTVGHGTEVALIIPVTPPDFARPAGSAVRAPASH